MKRGIITVAFKYISRIHIYVCKTLHSSGFTAINKMYPRIRSITICYITFSFGFCNKYDMLQLKQYKSNIYRLFTTNVASSVRATGNFRFTDSIFNENS